MSMFGSDYKDDMYYEMNDFIEEHSLEELLYLVYALIKYGDTDVIKLKEGMTRHGKWETNKVAFMKTCSLCGKSVDQSHDYNFCPECGAKMNLEGE